MGIAQAVCGLLALDARQRNAPGLGGTGAALGQACGGRSAKPGTTMRASYIPAPKAMPRLMTRSQINTSWTALAFMIPPAPVSEISSPSIGRVFSSYLQESLSKSGGKTIFFSNPGLIFQRSWRWRQKSGGSLLRFRSSFSYSYRRYCSCTSPAMVRPSVVLPEPEPPTSATTSPS